MSKLGFNILRDKFLGFWMGSDFEESTPTSIPGATFLEDERQDEFTASNDGEITFPLTDICTTPIKSKLFVNGIRQIYNTDYFIDPGNNLVWVSSDYYLKQNFYLTINYI